MKTIGFPLPMSSTLIPTPLAPLILLLNYNFPLSSLVPWQRIRRKDISLIIFRNYMDLGFVILDSDILYINISGISSISGLQPKEIVKQLSYKVYPLLWNPVTRIWILDTSEILSQCMNYM